MGEVRLIRPTARNADTTQTPGMAREEAIAIEGLWAGHIRTEPSMLSGWHHHGEHDSAIYVLTGRVRIESGPSGRAIADAGPGDFLLIPKQTVHREGNPAAEVAEAIVVRAGRGPVVVNVPGPDADT